MLPEPEQDQVVAGLLGRLWAQPHRSYPFRPLVQMCAAWADEFERDYAAAAAAERIDPGLVEAGITLLRELPRTARFCCAPTCMVTTSWPRTGNRG
jgi:streptomycin 6-kinase